MKGNKKILIAAILLLLITVSFTTYAIYRESKVINGTIKAAAWQVKVDGVAIASTTYTFGMDDIIWDTKTGYNDTIAPGSTGHINIPVDATGSEVDVIFKAEIGTITATGMANLPSGLTVTAAGTNGETLVRYNASDMSTDVVINVVWTGSIEDLSTKDTEDLTAQGKTLTIPVTLTARQSVEGHS